MEEIPNNHLGCIYHINWLAGFLNHQQYEFVGAVSEKPSSGQQVEHQRVQKRRVALAAMFGTISFGIFGSGRFSMVLEAKELMAAGWVWM